jgi:hypothetical protein
MLFRYASNAFRGLPIVQDPQVVPGDAWINGAGVPEEVIEETRWFRRFGATFSLLRER